ncbi:MAG: ribonuclease D [Steroidobacteraceae bacterium]
MQRVTEPLGARSGDVAAVEALAREIAASPHVALDTEFMRERTYRAQLCLLQIATPQRAACIDPLGPVALDVLTAPLASDRVVKIMHAARQDLEVLWPLFGTLPRVFDTQIAAGLAGFPAQIGYAELVRQLLDVTLPKGQTRTDWSRRPLSREQIEYALDDVVHLAPLMDTLQDRVDRLGRTAWLAEELAQLGRPEDLFVAPEKAWERLKGLTDLDEWRQGLAREVAAWRERRASDRNRPRSWILADNVLRGIVLRVPRSESELLALDEMPQGFVENSGAEMLSLVESLSPPTQLAPIGSRGRPDPTFVALVKKLGEVVRQAAAELQLAPELLATRRDLEAVARGEADAAPLAGWRAEVLGARLKAAL